LASLTALSACDVDHPGPTPFPPVNLVDISVATATDGGVPSSYVVIDALETTAEVVAKTSVRITFDRLLLPTETFRQSVCLRPFPGQIHAAKDCTNGVFLEPSYDPVRRQITYRQPAVSAGLDSDVDYTISVFPPPADGSMSGIAAFDGAPLELAASRTFHTRKADAEPQPPEMVIDTPPKIDFCGDLFPHLLRDTCSTNGCHTATGKEDHGLVLGAAEGLDFSTPARILATAVSHAAHETATGEHGSTVETSPSLFGRAMPILDPTRPGNSYALYKLLANVKNGAKGSTPALEQKRLVDLDRLRSVVVVGIPMPPSDGRAKELSQKDLEQLSDWIAQGAPTSCP
jgi:hypothetical protein